MPTHDNTFLDDDLRVRINSKELEKFKKKAMKSNAKPYPVLVREIIAAYNDGRLRIIPTKTQKEGELYNVPGK